MSKLILHVGSGKTGSTTIQKSLFRNKDKNDDVIFYPTLQGHRTNQIIRFAFCNVSETTINVKNKFKNDLLGFEHYQESIKEELVESCKAKDDILISSEFLFLSSPEEAKNIKAFFQGLGYEQVHVIMYVRNPANYYVSVAQQAIKHHPKIPSPVNFNYDILSAINSWSSINPDSFSIRSFEKDALYDNDVKADFAECLAKLGFNITLKDNLVYNESMSVEAVILLENIQSVVKAYEKNKSKKLDLKTRIFDFIKSGNPGTKAKLKNDVVNFIHQKYQSTYDVLERDYNLNLVDRSKIVTDVSDKLENMLVDVSFKDVVEDFDIDIYFKLLKAF